MDSAIVQSTTIASIVVNVCRCIHTPFRLAFGRGDGSPLDSSDFRCSITLALIIVLIRALATLQSSGAPDALLDVVGRDDRGLVVDLGGVLIEGDGGLGAEVAVLEVEVEGANAVRAEDAGELYASLDPLGRVGSHGLIVSPRWRGNGARWSGGEGNGGQPWLDDQVQASPACQTNGQLL